MPFPFSGTLQWQADPAGGVPTSYEVRQDGVLIGTVTGTAQGVTFPSSGTYQLKVKAINQYGSAEATLVEVAVPPLPPTQLLVVP